MMNKTPGFTAEASIYQPTAAFKRGELAPRSKPAVVRPAAFGAGVSCPPNCYPECREWGCHCPIRGPVPSA
jgi:hypothetical protein